MAAARGTDPDAVLHPRIPGFLSRHLHRLLAATVAASTGLAAARRELLLLRLLEQVAGVHRAGHLLDGLPRRTRDGRERASTSPSATAGFESDHEPGAARLLQVRELLPRLTAGNTACRRRRDLELVAPGDPPRRHLVLHVRSDQLHRRRLPPANSGRAG